jgi:hypothetical protein
VHEPTNNNRGRIYANDTQTGRDAHVILVDNNNGRNEHFPSCE